MIGLTVLLRLCGVEGFMVQLRSGIAISNEHICLPINTVGVTFSGGGPDDHQWNRGNASTLAKHVVELSLVVRDTR